MRKGSSTYMYFSIEDSPIHPNTYVKTKINFNREFPRKDFPFLQSAIEDILVRELNFPPNSMKRLTEVEFKKLSSQPKASIFDEEHNVY